MKKEREAEADFSEASIDQVKTVKELVDQLLKDEGRINESFGYMECAFVTHFLEAVQADLETMLTEGLIMDDIKTLKPMKKALDAIEGYLNSGKNLAHGDKISDEVKAVLIEIAKATNKIYSTDTLAWIGELGRLGDDYDAFCREVLKAHGEGSPIDSNTYPDFLTDYRAA